MILTMNLLPIQRWEQMKISINTNDGEGYSIILDELNSLSEVINYINTHDYLIGKLAMANRQIVIATDKITTIIG